MDSIEADAAGTAKEKAEGTALAKKAWGVGDSEASPDQMKLNRDVIERVRKSPTLTEVPKYLGRFKEMAVSNARKNGYAYGRGEKHTLGLGNDLNRVLSSDFSMLAVPATVPLFLRKHQTPHPAWISASNRSATTSIAQANYRGTS